MEISGTPTWHIFLSFIPWVNIYVLFRVCIDLAHKFKKSTGFGVATAFFSIICLPILGFSKKIQYDFGDSIEPEKNENNIKSQQMNYETQQEQSMNIGIPIYNQGMNSNEGISQNQTSEIISQPENSIPMQEQVYTQPVQTPIYTEPMNTMENVMPTQNEEIIVPIQVQNTSQEPVYQEPIQTQPMEFNQPVQEPIFSQPVQQQPLQNMVQEPVMTNTMVMPEQNYNQNSTMM